MTKKTIMADPTKAIYRALRGQEKSLSRAEIASQLDGYCGREEIEMLLSSFESLQDCLEQMCDDGLLVADHFGRYQRIEPEHFSGPSLVLRQRRQTLVL